MLDHDEIEDGRFEFNKEIEGNDNPEFDCTDAAHPAWWRGHDAATATLCSKIEDILEGRDDGKGTCSEPWGTIRRRLLQAVGPGIRSVQIDDQTW